MNRINLSCDFSPATDMDNMSGCEIFTSQPVSLAMAYVPWQLWEQPYQSEIGFDKGTIFPSLDKPFLADEGAFCNE